MKGRKHRKLFLTVSSISHEKIKLVGNIGNKGNYFFPFLPISHDKIELVGSVGNKRNLSHRFFNFSRKDKARRKYRKGRKSFSLFLSFLMII